MGHYNRIIFAAESGTCRAPMAAGIMEEYSLKHPAEILAKGIVVLFPEPLNQKAEAVMISNGINMNGFMSVQLEAEDFTEDTLILVMERAQLQKVIEKFPEADTSNVYVLTGLVGDELEIFDPYGGTLQSYGLCYETLRKTIRKLVNYLNEESVSGQNEETER
jgi:protein-tyrosine phosphatase